MIENNNELILILSKRKYIIRVLCCIILLGIGISIMSFDFQRILDMYNYIFPVFLIFGVLPVLDTYGRRKRLKKSKIDINKYFNFIGEIKTEIVIFLIIILVARTLKSFFYKIFGILVIILSLWMLAVNTINYLKKKPLLLINDCGIKININATYSNMYMLNWDEVEEVFIYNDNGYKTIGIYPSNMKEVLSKMSLLRRAMLGSPKIISISKNDISMDIDDLYIEIMIRMTNK
ncbi:STM3941 family protein [Clostridium sp. DL1XJH146]